MGREWFAIVDDSVIRYRGIGIRIEDDVLITKDGHEILSHECPKEQDDIEKLMRR